MRLTWAANGIATMCAILLPTFTAVVVYSVCPIDFIPGSSTLEVKYKSPELMLINGNASPLYLEINFNYSLSSSVPSAYYRSAASI